MTTRAASPRGVDRNATRTWFLVAFVVFLGASAFDDLRGVLTDPDFAPDRGWNLLGWALSWGTPLVCLRSHRWGLLTAVGAVTVSLATKDQIWGMIALPALIVFAAARLDRWVLAAAGALALGWTACVAATDPELATVAAWLYLPFLAATGAASWFLGHSHRRRREAEARVAVVQELAASAREHERRLLARELHDVVAHELTLIAMQATVMRVSHDVDKTEEARASIERTSRTALDELKRLLEVLRSSDVTEAAQDTLAPPAAQRLDDVVEELAVDLRRIGHPVEVACRTSDLPRSVELAADRVLREAVTNVVKHAGRGARVTIDVHEQGRELHLTVTNTLVDDVTPTGLPCGNSGLAGLADRMAMLGGSFTASADGDRWVARATLPLTAAPSARTANP